MMRRLLLSFLLLAFAASAHAQVDLTPDHFAFSPNLTYDPSVPSPATYLGYEAGEAYTQHGSVVGYLKAVAAASDRVTLHEYGETYEGRALYYLTVTTPAHHARIDEIRTNNLKLANPAALGADEMETLLANQPVVVWLSYNVHGNEGSSTEAAMQVLYHLAAATDPATTRLLEQSVVLIDPLLNPDGRERYVTWYKSMRSHVPNTTWLDLEHDEPWPGGRTNHYWFDLNRDWVWLVHPESQGRIAAYQQWLPQVHVDYHEQGFNNNYFIMPGTTPRNRTLPDAYDHWAEVFGRAKARAFDPHHVSYATREAFDFFYPGYGSSYPSVMGGIGMLTEQGGHSRGGRAVETDDGYILTLRQRIFDHYTTSLATVKASVENRRQLLEYYRDFFTPANSKHNQAAYFIADDGGNGYVYDVIDLMLKHDVEVYRTDGDATVRQAYSYWDGQPSSRTFAGGTFVIPTNQPRHVFINTLMQRDMALEDTVTYDMTTWSVPLAYNLDAAWTTTRPTAAMTRVTEPPTATTGVVNPGASYAYLIDWNQRHAPKALSMLWDAGYRVRATRKALGDGSRTFGPGTLIVLLGRNRDRMDRAPADMQRIATEAGVEIVGMNTGWTETGISLSSRDSRVIERPKTALLVDSPTSSYTAGQLWFLFDRWTHFGLDRIRTDDFASLRLEDYDVLILPGAFGLSSVFDSTQIARLRRWVQGGGTLVATEGSAFFLTKDQSGLTRVEVTQDPKPEKKDEEADAPKPSYYTTYAAREDSAGFRRIPGAAFRGHLDTSHPLAFGMPEQVYSLRFTNDALEPSDNLHTVGYLDRDADAVVASGYASPQNKRKLAGKAFAAVQYMGQGEVVFLPDNTQYRMFWVGPARLMQNAVLLLPGM